jgi:hypothetical protein
MLLEGRNSNVLVFGFLCNLPNPSQIVIVAEVEKVVKEKWFQDALKIRWHHGHGAHGA